MEGAQYKCREVGGRPEKQMGHGEGMLVVRPTRADRGLDLAQPAGSWFDKGPLAGLRYQDARARPWCAPSLLEFVSVGDGWCVNLMWSIVCCNLVQRHKVWAAAAGVRD